MTADASSALNTVCVGITARSLVVQGATEGAEPTAWQEAMSYRANSVIAQLLAEVETRFIKSTGVEPFVDSIPYADWDIAYDFTDRQKPKIFLYSGLGAFGYANHPDFRVVDIFKTYLPDIVKIYKAN